MFCIPHDKLINGKWRHEIDRPQCEDNVVFPFPKTCQTNYECGMAMTCYNGKCLQSCTQENDCLPGQYCHSKHKVCHDFCKSDEECSIGYICYESKCVDKPSVSAPGTCKNNYHCETGMTCFEERCLPLCRQDPDCQSGQYCHDDHHVCHDFCHINNSCSSGYVCHNTRCTLASKCLTISGEDRNKTCIFPFAYHGIKFSTCTKMENGDVDWCSTQVDDRGNYIPGKWGNCGSNCPIELEVVY